MTTYTDEVNIYNPEAVGDGIVDAGKTATNYIKADETGIRIASSDPDNATTYQHQTATETEFVVDGASVAEFGGSGARIGADGSSQIHLGSDSLDLSNQDSASMFSVDLDAGSLTTTTKVSSNSEYTYGKQNVTSSGATLSRNRTYTLPDATAGSKISVDGTNIARLTILSADTSSTISGSGSYTGNNLSVVKLSSKSLRMGINAGYTITFTVGTKKTVTKTLTVPSSETGFRLSNGGYLSGNLVFTLKLEYGGANTIKQTATVKYNDAAATGGSASFPGSHTIVYFATPSIRVMQTTVGAALSFGTRGEGNVGVLSATLGEGLVAAGKNQTVIGQYNVEDTNNAYAFIIGNGTAEDAKSNALAVTRDGDIETAKDTAWIDLNGTIKYRIHHGVCYVCGDSAYGGIQVGTNGTTVGTLPAEARPSVEVKGAASAKSKNDNGQFSVDQNGVITVWNLTGNSVYWCFTVAYPVDA